jgi:hypothetical protein
MKKIAIIFLFCINPIAAKEPLYQSQKSNTLPTPQYVWPDIGFRNVAFGFPTEPKDQVLANNHLYVAMGAYVVIYEIQGDGTLRETGSKMLPKYIFYIDHDGSYLYASTEDGEAAWDATGSSSGVYFARLKDGDKGQSIKLILLK